MEKCRVITVPWDKSIESDLKSRGYKKRSGCCSHWPPKWLNIVPKKKWFWLHDLGVEGSRIEQF